MRTRLDAGFAAEAISALSDEEVVVRVLAGETALFELLLRRHNQRLFRAARAILRNDSEAEDAMQEAWVHAFAHLDQFAGGAKLSTWLTKIAVYEALGRLRRAKRQEDLPEAMRDSADPERDVYTRELRSAIESAVDDLPDMYRTVFVLRELDEMTVAETAEILGITEESVKTRLHRARALLRARLERALETASKQTFEFLGERCDRITTAVMDRLQTGSP